MARADQKSKPIDQTMFEGPGTLQQTANWNFDHEYCSVTGKTA
jgi:hypothetical protein